MIAALTPPLTAANYYYTEARPYGIVLGVITVALLCWRRGDKWGMAGLALSLALAVSFHYYGIFAALCIGAAEIVRSILLRKLRLAVWLALAAGSACLAIYWPLLQAFKRYYGAHFWAKPKLLAVFTAYGHILDLPQSLAVPFVTLVFVLAGVWIWRLRDGDEAIAEDFVGALALCALPIFAFVLTKVTGGGLTDRYMLPTAIGLCVTIGLLSRKLSHGGKLLTLLFLSLAYVVHEAKVLRGTALVDAANFGFNEIIRTTLAAEPDQNTPVVISSGHQFLPAAYYAPRQYASRIVALVDPAASLRYAQSDTADLNLLAYRKYLPVQVTEFHDFASRHSRFYLLTGRQYDLLDWWPARLVDSGYTLKLVGMTDTNNVYLVLRDGTLGRGP